MRSSLYDQIFARMDELGAIRKDLSFGCEACKLGFKVPFGIAHDCSSLKKDYDNPPVLSDCNESIMLSCIENGVDKLRYMIYIEDLSEIWDNSKPYLKDQSDELGSKLLELIK